MNDELDGDFKYLIKLIDIDGDVLSIASPWNDNTLMMRIENDDIINGFIIDLPIAMALMSVLLPLIRDTKLEQALDDFMNPEKDFP
jgi:hypothetical protein